MIRDFSFGVIPVRVVDGRREFLVVQHRGGHWGFPKGHPEGDETPVETARRELAEETGLTQCEIIEDEHFEEHYYFTKRSGKRVHKTVVYFIGMVQGGTVTPQAAELLDYFWGDLEATRRRLSFDEGRDLLTRAEHSLAQT